MPAKYPYKKMAWYPHMGEKDAAIWSRFLDANPEAFDYCWYDLPVGSGEPVPLETQQNLKEDWLILTKYKCDVIGFKDGKPTIIEVKPRAGLGAVGQVITYDLLYQEYVDGKARPNLIILTDALRSDMDWLCEEFGIEIIVV